MLYYMQRFKSYQAQKLTWKVSRENYFLSKTFEIKLNMV